VQSKDELRLDEKERKRILRCLMVGSVATATDSALSHDNPSLDDNAECQKGGTGGESADVSTPRRNSGSSSP
jgi:hypothetical protein